MKKEHNYMKIFNKESARGQIIVSAIRVEEILKSLLKLFFIDDDREIDNLLGEYGILASFAAKSRLCYAVGIINKSEKNIIEAIIKIRNLYAHILSLDLDSKEILLDDETKKEIQKNLTKIENNLPNLYSLGKIERHGEQITADKAEFQDYFYILFYTTLHTIDILLSKRLTQIKKSKSLFNNDI